MCLDQIPCVAETTEWWCVMSWVRREQLPEDRVCFWKNGGTHGLWAWFPHMLGPRGAWNPCMASVLACTQPWCLSHRVLMLLMEWRNSSFPCHPQEWDVPFHIVISSKSFKNQNLKKKKGYFECVCIQSGPSDEFSNLIRAVFCPHPWCLMLCILTSVSLLWVLFGLVLASLQVLFLCWCLTLSFIYQILFWFIAPNIF